MTMHPPYLEMMLSIACGESVPWRLDLRYPTEGPPEKRYPHDKQAPLWQFYLCSIEKKKPPQWAADALVAIMGQLFRDDLPNWERAFGQTLARKTKKKAPLSKRGVYAHTIQKDYRILAPLWIRARKLLQQGKDEGDRLYEDLAGEFGLPDAKVAGKYYRQMRDWITKECPQYL